MTEPMDLTRFEEMAMTHGPDLADWPEGARAPAAALLARSAEAAAVRDLAAETFAALDAEAADPPAASPALMSRILADAAAAAPAPAAAPRPARRGHGAFQLFWRLTPPAALAASALLGVALGYSAADDLGAAAVAEAEDEIWMETVSLVSEPSLFDEGEEGEGL